ncbi:MAG: GGDEF domain-containing protein [Lachnospiraceae bacterium]|nr:GGDEF domain-containing protein [Lachnospiraceae bacterium]
MNIKKTAFAQRVSQNSKNYFPRDLFDLEAAGAFLESMHAMFGLDTLMTDRHGAILMVHGAFDGFVPDVKNKPGNKIRVRERTVCHIYARYDNVAQEKHDEVKTLLDAYIKTLEGFSEKSYLASEQAVYIDELEQQVEKDAYQVKYSEQNDPLTGVLNRNYFMSRMRQLEEREGVPTAVICVNINDWKFFDDRFGEEESDRLVITVADILRTEAREAGFDKAVIGRIEGDVFNVLLPDASESAAAAYCESIQRACDCFEDERLVPSIAVGCVMRTNVEESYKDVLSDAEYAMLENKFEIKNTPGYRQKIEKAINKS